MSRPAAVRSLVLCGAFAAAWSMVVDAQQSSNQPRALTAADYERAERFMPYNTTPLVLHSAGRATWVAGQGAERFWYRTTTEQGSEVFIVNTADGTRSVCDLPACCASAGDSGRAGGPPSRLDVHSPDGKRTAFIRDWNLWVRDIASGKETALTKDGVKDFGYGTDNAGWTRSARQILVWSPDSRKIATFQQDQRRVGEMYLVDTVAGHPTLQAWKYPLPGDETVTMTPGVVIAAASAKVVRSQMPPDHPRSTLCDALACRGGE